MVSICRISVSRVLFFLRRRRVCMRSMLTSLADTYTNYQLQLVKLRSFIIIDYCIRNI